MISSSQIGGDSLESIHWYSSFSFDSNISNMLNMMKSKTTHENHMDILFVPYFGVNEIKLLLFRYYNYQKHSNSNCNGIFLGCNNGSQVNHENHVTRKVLVID